MGVSLGGSGNYLRRTANLPSSTAFTAAGWVKFRSVREAWEYFLALEAASNYDAGGIDSSDDTVLSSDVQDAYGSNMPTGVWLFVYLKCSGTGATSLEMGWMQNSDTNFTIIQNFASSFTPTQFTIGNDIADEFVNCDVRGFRLWNTVLTDAELKAEKASTSLVKTANINGFWDLPSVGNYNDTSGNGYNLTVGGTLATSSDDPPIYGGSTQSASITESGSASDIQYLVHDLFGVATVPVDNSTNTASPSAITPPSNMLLGDLVIVVATARASSGTLSMSNAGGQSWNTLTQYNNSTTTRQQIFWCIFNGTWSASPQVTFGSTTNNEAQMFVFRPMQTCSTWVADTSLANTAVSAPSSPHTFTQTGITPNNNNNIILTIFHCIASNTWSSLSGTNWRQAGVGAQYRDTSGSGQTNAYAFQLQGTKAASNNVALNESATTAGHTSILAFYEYAIISNSIVESGSANDSEDASISSPITTSIIVESASVIDAPSAISTETASVTEGASANDTPTAIATEVASIIEAASATDTPSGGMVQSSSITEVSNVIDTPNAITTEIASIIETANAIDIQSEIAIEPASTIESANANDAPSTGSVLSASISEPVSAIDIPSTTAIEVATITEAANANDTSNASEIISASIVEPASAQESSDTQEPILASIIELVNALDAQSNIITAILAIAEVANAIENSDTINLSKDTRYAKEAWEALEYVWENGAQVSAFGSRR